MIVRRAELRDWAALKAGAEAFAAQSGLDCILSEDPKVLHGSLAALLETGRVVVFVAEADGEIQGGIGMTAGPYLWNPDSILAEEIFWFVNGEAPKAALSLLKAAREWSEEVGATHLMFHSLESSPPKVARVYGAMGLEPVQRSFLGKL